MHPADRVEDLIRSELIALGVTVGVDVIARRVRRRLVSSGVVADVPGIPMTLTAGQVDAVADARRNAGPEDLDIALRADGYDHTLSIRTVDHGVFGEETVVDRDGWPFGKRRPRDQINPDVSYVHAQTGEPVLGSVALDQDIPVHARSVAS